MLAQAVNTTAPEGSHQHHVASHRQSYIAHATMPDASTEDKVCPGCQLSVMNENGGVVISFGSSFFHVDCFKCAKCHNTVTADTNLLLLSDGQPVCSNCSYSCSVCHLPILDEAIMTGDDSYHAHCFKCKSCGNRIDELMFAKTHNGIYCMNCHNQRVARSRRHAAKQKELKEREAREREQRERAASASAAGSASSREQLVREHSTPISSPRPSTAQSPPMSREPSALARRPSLDTVGRSHSGQSTHASPSSTPNPMVSPIYERFMRSSPSRPSSPQVIVGPTEQAHDPSSASPAHNGLEDHLSPPGSAQEVARKPSHDRGVRELYKKHDPAGSQTNLSLPSAKGRSSKRNSINPGMAFDIDTAASELGYATPSTGSGRGSPAPMNTLSPQTPASGLSASSPITRLRAESSPKPSTSTGADFPARPALTANHTMDRVPQALSPAGPRVRPQRSFDTRDNGREPRHAPSLSIDVEKSRGGPTSGRTSPGHKVASPNHRADVPHGVESGTDTDAENDSDHPPEPPAKSPKEPISADRTPRPEKIAAPGSAAREGSPEPGSSDESVDQVRTSTFIAPALPPIRISLGAGDFGELLKSYNHTRSGSLAKAGPLSAVDEASPNTELVADRERERERGPSPDTPASNASWRSDMTPTTSSQTHATSLEAEPRFQDDASMTTIGATSSTAHSSSNGHAPNKAEPFPSIADLSVDQQRSRSDSSASAMMGDATPITVTAPGSTVARPLKVDTSDLVMRRLREALAEAGKRGAMHVNLDQEFVQTILMVLEQRRVEHAELKGKIDHIKRASQQYVDGLTVAQGEYEAELQARRDAEAEVTRLRVLLNGQAARITAMSNDARKGELHKQLSRELSENLTVLERNLSRLRVERDVVIAEVEELETSKGSSNSMPSEPSSGANLKRSLTMRLDTLKQQYQRELVPLTDERGALLREIAELKAARDIFLEETTMLNARNEELAALNAIYSRRQEQAPESMRTDSSGSQNNQADTSLGSGDFVKIQHPSAAVVQQAQLQAQQQMQQAQYQAQQQAQALAAQVQRDNAATASGEQGTLKKRGWLAGVRRDAGPGTGAPDAARLTKFKHSFQQISVLRVTRCDHCGDKLWGSQVRCTGCNLSVHHRCQAAVQSACTPQATPRKDAAQVPLQPSMFGRELIEQVRADSRGGDRMVPVIVEKCIEAVEHHAMEYEGIYRKTGGSAQNKKITALFERQDYESFDLNDEEQFNDICSVTSVLKTYFRSLPNPLMTFVLHDEFMNTSMIKDPNHKAAKYADLVKQLPTEHYYTLRMLIHHLHRIHEHNSVNLMTARNLGVVFGPTLMRSRNPGAEFSDMAGKALTVEFLVENAPDVFP
ncbi:unnamed protein product [Peniophora sp. CBMAI 1063]|nr:unnamed protein product [Peniophora sp. CBMAI 1063]